ncbi:MAG: ATP-dependent DNA helicase RecG [Verrucomicrobiales bacterium]|jgi:ATP-dependent DNA helicase RecG|nr:ATP-dependent DNA helicase RecG [Verrucomicrobiales bacterium]MBP9224499.1 ATP-dependent DNA helicase RecG [Verrucomicrobiales bacterium]
MTTPMWNLETKLEESGLIRLDKKSREGFSKLGLETVGDALSHYPRRHEDRSHFDRFPENAMERAVCLHVMVTDCRTLFGKGKRRGGFEVTVEPPGGDILGNRIILRWFNMPYLQKVLTVGHELVLYGQPKESGRRVVIDHPDFEIIESGEAASEAHMGRIVPIYPLSSGVNQKALRGLIYELLQIVPDSLLPDWLPPGNGEDYQTRAAAIRTIHYPDTMEGLETARRYLALEEFARLQLILQQRRAAHRKRGGIPHAGPGEMLRQFLAQLPFSPTRAQERTIGEIHADLASPFAMSRLLQGDVGAGKTLVAAAAILLTVEAGYDAALMAPTQILAEQHFQTFRGWLEPLGVNVKLLTGTRDESGELPLFAFPTLQKNTGSLTIGTHALLHGRAEFEKGLGLAVIDEQHKFGVAQREALIAQGDSTDVLVMTATPIPRTLTLAFYGDLDVSILDELPAGRGKIITGIRLTTQTSDAAKFVKDQLAEGRQAYLVYPLIDESETLTVGAASIEFEEWKKRLPEYEVELLHGRMGAEEKDRVMERFRSGKAEVLVSTTVIEVGVDVPNANVMLIYNAERFGLAQLHQLRGRIGRGAHKSFCVLMIPPDQVEARTRLKILEDTRDGFRIADEDLRLRGPGEVLGTQQSGLPDLKFASFLGDARLVEEARAIATEMMVNESSP